MSMAFGSQTQDLDQLLAIISQQAADLCALQEERDRANAAREEAFVERDHLIAEREEALAEVEKLRLLIRQLQRAMYGRRSEQLDPDQLQLGLEDLEQELGEAEAKAEAREDAKTGGKAEGQTKARAKAKRNRGHLPKHLPRIERIIEPEEKLCPCCNRPMHVIGEDKSEQLDVVPAKLQVTVTRRPRYGCRDCAGAVVQAPAPERPITGGMATTGLLAHILLGKYGDHLPLYRQSQILARSGIDLDRATLANWVGQTTWWLEAIYRRMHEVLLSSTKIFADETTLPVLDPGNGKTKTGYFWAYAIDDRPWVGNLPPLVVYIYGDGRGGKHVAAHLAGFNGVVQVDAYGAYNRLADPKHATGAVKLAFCWAHWRRKLYDFHESTGSPIAKEALRRIAELYAIEKKIRGFGAEQRRTVRAQESRPLIEAFKAWLEAQLGKLSAKSKLAEIIRYALTRWDGFILFLEDGRVELDTNVVERTIRPIKLTKKNALFAGSDRGAHHWAVASSIIQTCKLNHVEPFTYLKDVLDRMVSGETSARQIDQLLPWNWTPPDTS